ncbi:hypothetical protein [Streptomyces erythrochromogenes]|uniref:hypothetical protein n=1 Tax=Streptomyces erythrochromogenes TaxID=285574 RepID=UPI003433E583
MLTEFSRKFEEVTAEVRSTRGDPAFIGKYDDGGFPVDCDAVMLASWSLSDLHVMVALKHEDQGLPFRIVLKLLQ